ncbi:unnamed protein product [Gordionus sp. m RMFG-2023]
MDIFIACLCILCTLCFILYITTKTILPPSNDITFKNLQRAYLIVYILGIAGDWLQGPYVYVLYQSYGMTSHQIEILFVAGFGSSMLFGTLVGALADKYGRRFNCILYGILYGISCLTKHFPNFWILMIGRLFGGIATSILYSALESWLICESNSRGLDSQSLSAIFSRAYLGNSIVAIVSGLIAQIAVNFFGYVAPFDISFLVLMAMIVVIIFSWSENYGNPKSDIFTTFKTGFTYIKEDHKIFCLGITQSLFEGCMYTFVLEWTPSLSLIRKYDNRLNLDDYLASKNYSNSDYVTIRSNFMGEEYVLVTDNDIPHGYIFAGFMIAIMIGSLLFKVLSTRSTPESFMRYVLMISSSTFLIPILFPGVIKMKRFNKQKKSHNLYGYTYFERISKPVASLGNHQ